MKKLILALSILLLPSFAMSATLDPPWKCIEQTRSFEYWYNPSDVTINHDYIATWVWEIYPEGRTAKKRVIFEWDTGKWAQSVSKGYRYGELVANFNFSQNSVTGYDASKDGYILNEPKRLDKKLFKILKNGGVKGFV